MRNFIWSSVLSVATSHCAPDNSACDVAMAPLTVPAPTSTLQLSFGTATSFPTTYPIGGPVVVHIVLLTRDRNGCPYPSPDRGVSGDLVSLAIGFVTLPNQPVSGTFPINNAGAPGVSSVTTQSVNSGNAWTEEYFTNAYAAANGTVTISKYVEGVEVAGSFDVSWYNGTELVASFDVPFCTAACGN
jgi:hypothetical protein